MLFLDTNIISYFLSGHKNVTTAIVNRFEDNVVLCMTVVNVYEVLKGFRWRKNKQFETKFNALLKNLRIYTIDERVVDIASKRYSELRRKGINICDADILIAGIVIANNGILVTNNTKHFKNIDHLKIENWV